MSYEEVAELFQVGRATINRWLRLSRETGGVEPRPHAGGHPHRIPDDKLLTVAIAVEKKPDSTLAELVEAYAKKTGLRVSLPTMGRALDRLNITRKKRPSSRKKGTAPRSSRPGSRSSKR
jgi:transposase